MTNKKSKVVIISTVKKQYFGYDHVDTSHFLNFDMCHLHNFLFSYKYRSDPWTNYS